MSLVGLFFCAVADEPVAVPPAFASAPVAEVPENVVTPRAFSQGILAPARILATLMRLPPLVTLRALKSRKDDAVADAAECPAEDPNSCRRTPPVAEEEDEEEVLADEEEVVVVELVSARSQDDAPAARRAYTFLEEADEEEDKEEEDDDADEEELTAPTE